jgi:hypothetical protein
LSGIHAFLRNFSKQGVDGRDKPGHDSGELVEHEIGSIG